MKLIHHVILLVGATSVLYSCGSKEAEASETEATPAVVQDTTAVTVSDTTKFKFDFTIANIPSPATSMQEFASWNVMYDNSILNAAQNVGKYTTEFKRSLNLGVYNIDMAYAMMNNKGPDVLSYMKVVMQLGDNLGLKNAINAMVGKRAEANINSRDSLFVILDDIFVKSDSYLRTNDRVYTAATVFAGSWIENLYLTAKLSEHVTDAKASAAIHNLLWEQRFHLGNLIGLLNDFKTKKECADLIASLKPIHEEIVAYHEASEITNEKYKIIADKIIALRNSIVE